MERDGSEVVGGRPARILVNYAHRRFLKAQVRCARTAIEKGGFDAVRRYGRRDLPWGWWWRHRRVLAARTGAGFWLWKPKLLSMTLDEVPEGAIVCYCDSGSFWLASVEPYLALLDGADVLAFTAEPEHTDLRWTKAEVRLATGLSDAAAREPQRIGGYVLVRNSPSSRALVREWLVLCETDRWITDDPGRVPEAPEFQGHRRDQSLWSIVCKRRGVRTVPDPSQYGNARRPPHLPQVVDCARSKD
jgi:hypothetical protein